MGGADSITAAATTARLSALVLEEDEWIGRLAAAYRSQSHSSSLRCMISQSTRCGSLTLSRGASLAAIRDDEESLAYEAALEVASELVVKEDKEVRRKLPRAQMTDGSCERQRPYVRKNSKSAQMSEDRNTVFNASNFLLDLPNLHA